MADTDALRTELIELLASAEYTRIIGLAGSPDGQWELLPETVRDNWRNSFARTADLVIETGWRPAAKPIGYITGFRLDGDWRIPFDGKPFDTLEEAENDAQDASRDEQPGVDWRALTVYDEVGEPYQAVS